MTRKQAVGLLVAIVKGEHPGLRDVTFGHNCYVMLGSRTPAAERDHKTYERITEAIEIVEGLK